MKLPGRFEWKLLAATLIVALLSVGSATYVVYFAAKRFFTYADEHQQRTGGIATQAAELFRVYFADRKEEFHRRADALAAHPPARLSELEGESGLLRARLLEGDRVVDEWAAPADVLAHSREAPPILSPVPATSKRPRALELTFGIPAEMYRNFQELRQGMDRERELDRAFDVVAWRLPRVFVIALATLLAIAPLIGLVIARRATRRLALLQDAARRVGAGDLSVRVRPTGRDELDDLGRAFDSMVEEITAARARIEYMQKVSAWQEVARRLAHEIKNPLTPIQLAMQELSSKYKGDDPAYRKLLGTASEILHEEIGVLRRLVDDFSAFAKLSQATPEATELASYVAEWVRQHPEWVDAITVVPVANPAATTALCDRGLGRRVLANLIENAAQAAEGAGRKPRIEVRVEPRPERQRVAIVIDDNGPGVQAADRQRIFDPYVTFKENGTGLGLSIVRKIVIDLGGDVTVGAAPPPLSGARFTVELPQS